MTTWVLDSLRRRVATTRWPAVTEQAPGVTPGCPVGVGERAGVGAGTGVGAGVAEGAHAGATVDGGVAVGVHAVAAADAGVAGSVRTGTAAERCPTEALEPGSDTVHLERCVHCFRCRRGVETPAPWRQDFAWARWRTNSGPLPDSFRRSIHVRVVDAGDCGACLAELLQLSSPEYSLHRLGIFLTATPRQADVLLVVGPVTGAMYAPLAAAYQAMPTPRRVVAAGACAASGGLFGPSFACAAGAGDAVPVDLVIPGCPPPPLAILEGLLQVMAREPAHTAEAGA